MPAKPHKQPGLPDAKRLRRLAHRHATELPWFQAAAAPVIAVCVGLVADRAFLGGKIAAALGMPLILGAVLTIPTGIILALWMDLRARARERLTRQHLCPRCLYPLTQPGEVIPHIAHCGECGLDVPTVAYFEAFPEARWRLRGMNAPE